MDKEKIGRFICALRKEQGLTQKELAERLHVSDRTVSKWERGAGLPASMDKEKIGRFICALRKEQGLTQKELAERLHVSDRTVSKWERGAGLPNISILPALADSLGIALDELLEGQRSAPCPSEARAAARQVLRTTYRHMLARERALLRKGLASLLLLAVVLGSGALLFRHLSADRILFPPRLTCELLQRDADIGVRLLVDRATSGVYDYIRSYELDRYGRARLNGGQLWQSYSGAVPAEVYRQLRALCPGDGVFIDPTENGYLYCCYPTPDSVTVLETDLSMQPVFRATLPLQEDEALCAAIPSDKAVYLLHWARQQFFLTEIDRDTGRLRTIPFDPIPWESSLSPGGILFHGRHMWVRGGVLYFAETHYHGETSALLCAYDIERGQVISFTELEHRHVVAVQPDAASGQVSILLDPMDYQPLELYTPDSGTLEVVECLSLEHRHVVAVQPDAASGQVSILLDPMDYQPLELYTPDSGTLEVVECLSLELPHEIRALQGSVYEKVQYLLFEADLTDAYAAVLFDTLPDGDRGLLSVYDRESGQAVWRGLLSLEGPYEICGIELLPQDG